MLDYLKKQPLVGLAIAIAFAVAWGIILAHIVTKAGDALYETNPGLVNGFAIGSAGTLLLYGFFLKRKSMLDWLRLHRKVAAYSVCAVGLAVFALVFIANSNERKATAPVYLDSSTGEPITSLSGDSMSIAPHRDPVVYAKCLQLGKQLGHSKQQTAIDCR